MQWCKELGTEPYLCLNFGTGTLEEALAWVEYCNGDKNTHYANLRRKNGHEKPYKVKYWALGNEVWGPWQVGEMTKEAYATQAYQWAKALKLLDPEIELVLCGREGATSWDYHTLKTCIQNAGVTDLGEPKPPLIDMHSIHLYTASEDHYENVTAPLAAERSIEITASLIDLAQVENGIPASQPRPSICFDEWNVWLPSRAPGFLGGEEKYTLSDALAVAVWLNIFVRQSRDVQMACLAQSVNVLSPLMTTKSGIVKQTTWYPYELFCKNISGHTLACHVCCESYSGSTRPGWLESFHRPIPMLHVSASVDKSDVVSLCVVNMHLENDADVMIQGLPKGTEVTVYTVTGKDHKVTNVGGNDKEVTTKESKWTADGKAYRFPKISFTMLRWQAGEEKEAEVRKARRSAEGLEEWESVLDR